MKGSSDYTVVMPVKEPSPFLSAALDSVLQQTRPASEVLLIVDKDDPEPRCALSQPRHHSIKINVVRSMGSGLIEALNAGISATSTPLIAFLDSDDLWSTSKQERQLELLETLPEVEAVYSKAVKFRGDTPSAGVVLATHTSMTFTGTTFRRQVFERLGSLDPQATDHTWLYRWWAHAQDVGITLGTIDEIGLWRRVHGMSIWSENYATAHQDLLTELRSIIHMRRSPPTNARPSMP